MELEMKEQRPISTAEVVEKLEAIKKERKELNFRAAKVYDYVNEFSNKKKKQVDEMFQKIMDLNIPRLKEKHVIKVLDIQPENVDALKAVMSGEDTTLKAEDMKKIIDVIKA